MKKNITFMLLGISLLALFWIALRQNTTAVDWHATYYPAARALLALKSPYKEAPLFFAPVWSLIPLLPFALFPANVGGALYFVVSLIGFGYLGYKLQCQPLGLIAILLSAPVANCIQTGNIEWLALLGLVMPPHIGLIFFSMKPQATVGLIIFVLYNAFQKDWRELVKIVTPTLIFFIFSTLVYGPWFLRIGGAFDAAGGFAIKLWPYGIPIGLLLLGYGIKQQKIELPLAASPFLSPYTILVTWSGFILSFSKSTKKLAAVSVASWIFWILFRY